MEDVLRSARRGLDVGGRTFRLSLTREARGAPASGRFLVCPSGCAMRARVGAAQLDGKRVREEDVERSPTGARARSARARCRSSSRASLLQDFTGVPLLVDLAAMRSAVARLGKDPRVDRAAGAGRPRRRPLGPGRLLRHARRAPPEHGDGVQRNRARYEFLKWGTQAFDRLQRRAARHRHLPPGEPRVPGARAFSRATASLSRTRSSAPTRTHHDQRARHRGLGRRRHRGRGGDARPARLLPHAGRRRRSPHRRAARGRHRDRPRPARHRDAAQGEGRRQVRRVPRRGRRDAVGARPRDHREHGARVRRDDGLLPGRRGDAATTSRRPAAPTSRSTRSAPTTRPRAVRNAAAAASATTRRCSSWTSRRSSRRRRAEAPAGPHRARRAEGALPRAAHKPVADDGYGKPADDSASASDQHRRRPATPIRSPAAASRTPRPSRRGGAHRANEHEPATPRSR